ncbi:MAG: TA system antitoxin ParD family protein [Actinomycetota bacterium]
MAGQVEYWAFIGKIAEDNPDLSYSVIKEILLGREQLREGLGTEYVFGEGD